MKISAGIADITNYSEFAACFVFEDALDIPLAGAALVRYKRLCKSRAFEGKLLQTVSLQDGNRTLLIIGLGKKFDFDPEYVRRGAAMAYRTADELKVSKLEIILQKPGTGPSKLAGFRRTTVGTSESPTRLYELSTAAEWPTAGNWELRSIAQAACEGAILASHRLDKWKNKDEKEEEKRELSVFICNKDDKKEVSEGVRLGKIMAEAQNYVREINENPSNIVTPKTFADEAKRLSKQYGMKIKIMDSKNLEKNGMNGILSVGKGSANEPLLVTVEYDGTKNRKPKSGNAPVPLYAVVGKGITFDSGGISLKPSKNMHEMKYDKSGACIVLGVLKAAAEMKFPVRILGVIPLAENKPSGTASNPGDIIKMYNGKTVEILNTDAEGRLILGDALAYAAERKPAAIIDVATLTGSIIVCLGRHAIGLFSNDVELAAKLKTAGQKTFERVWEFPLWKEYSEMIKGEFADIKNIGTDGEGGSITAAAFLKEFVGETKWAHLDIAGVDNVVGKHPIIEKGATGTGTRLIIQGIIELTKK